MIYDKPRDINLRVVPSFYTLVQSRKKSKRVVKEVAEPKNVLPEKVIPKQEELIIDISKMPVIKGIPMLELPDIILEEPPVVIPEKAQPTNTADDRPIDISTLPDIEDVPILILPDLPVKEEVALPQPPPIIKEAAPTAKKKAPKKQKVEKTTAKKKKPKQIRNKKQLLKAAVFFVMLYVGTALAFAIPLRPTYSETEKRQLEPFPEFSAKDLASGEYFSDISTWFSDTFPYRELLTKANTSVKRLYGFDTVKIHGDTDAGAGDEIPDVPLIPPETIPTPQEPDNTDNNNIPQTKPDENKKPDKEKPVKTQSFDAIIVAGDSAYEYYAFSESLAPRFINSVNSIKSVSGISGEVYAMIAPTSMDITLEDSVRKGVNSADQKKALQFFNSSFTNAKAVKGIYENEKKHSDEYTYFRTDHHWTALGAYYAYEEFAEAKGIKPIPLSKYKAKTYEGFLGTFYAQSGQSPKLSKTPDSVTVYEPYNNVSCVIEEASGKTYNWNVVADASQYSTSMKYLAFIGGDNALTTITNKDNPKGETCVVIKESYGNAFVPFLIPHYSKIYVIDPRHYNGTLSEFTANKKIDDVIFIANISTTRNSVYIESMEDLIK